ncbi:unnamed protein product [Rotaria sordida]|uniref:Kinesin light chain n=1 Tax=Rotaria sordida TaxID=392033 RepID=A0A815LRF6_9BILA|nr:unnamed protein product [Rotaria sordida]CAF1409415.1 unnamed protein product [Rotaria sordida]
MPLNNVATMHFEAGHYDVATSEFLQLLKLRETYLSTDDPMLICTYNNLAICLLMKGDMKGAVDKAEKALTLCKKHLPENDPTRASVEGNLGDVYYQLGRQKEGIFHCENALTIQKRCMPSGHRFLITAHRNLGNKYTAMGNYGEALAHLESALTIEQHQANVDPLSLASTFNGIGCVLSGQGRKDEALSYFQRVLQLIPENHPQRISALQRLDHNDDLILTDNSSLGMISSNMIQSENMNDNDTLMSFNDLITDAISPDTSYKNIIDNEACCLSTYIPINRPACIKISLPGVQFITDRELEFVDQQRSLLNDNVWLPDGAAGKLKLSSTWFTAAIATWLRAVYSEKNMDCYVLFVHKKPSVTQD